MMKLGITRTAIELRTVIEEARKKRIEVIPLPLVGYRQVQFEPISDMIPRQNAWLVFTSARGVDSFIGYLRNKEIELPKSVKIAAVGAHTAKAVKAHGHDVCFLPSTATGESFFKEFIAQHANLNSKVLYASAEDISFNPNEIFDRAGIQYKRLVVYRAIPLDSSSEPLSELSDRDAILFTSPMTVRIFDKAYGTPKPRVIAIGSVTEREMKQNDWPVDFVLTEPDIERAIYEIGAAVC